VSETVPQVSPYRVTNPDKVLPGKALVQIVLGRQRSPGLVADPPSAGNGTDWVRRRKADKEKDYCRYRKKNRYKEEKPLKDIPNRKMHFKPYGNYTSARYKL
jgi:hypothetical protein